MEVSETVNEAVRRIVEAAHPRRILLFGSHARGGAGADSDIDLLVIVSRLDDRRGETVRLERSLSGLNVPIDVLLFTEQQVADWGDVRGTVLYPALREGVVLYEAA